MSEETLRYGVTAICESHENKGMTLDEYQRRAMTTCMTTCDNEAYMVLNLVGEVGELASKMAKAIRKGRALFDSNRFITEWGDESMTDAEIRDLKAEVGDVQWQLAGLCHVMGWTLEEVARENLGKLTDRRNRGVIDGSGDNR